MIIVFEIMITEPFLATSVSFIFLSENYFFHGKKDIDDLDKARWSFRHLIIHDFVH